MKYSKMSDMAKHERPIEKLLAMGPGSLSDAELLAIILRTGSKDMNVVELSQYILNAHPIHKGLRGLNYRHVSDLKEIGGMGDVKAASIIALTEISRRISSEKAREEVSFDSPESIADYFMEEVRYLTKERVYALFMNSNNVTFHKVLLSEGSIDRSILTPRELFVEALKANAVKIVLLHNHPSGNPVPSKADIVLTKRISLLGEEIGIELVDHIIIGDGRYTSLKESGEL